MHFDIVDMGWTKETFEEEKREFRVSPMMFVNLLINLKNVQSMKYILGQVSNADCWPSIVDPAFLAGSVYLHYLNKDESKCCVICNNSVL